MTTNQYYQDYASAGVSLVPVKTDGSKAPAVPWKQFQRQPADSETVQKWIDRGHGIGLIGGTVSGNLEVLDFEAGADIRAFADRLDQAARGLREKLSLLVGTPQVATTSSTVPRHQWRGTRNSPASLQVTSS